MAALDISYTLGARGVARLETVDTENPATASAYRPTLDQPLIINNQTGTVMLFAGHVLGIKDRALGSPNVGVVTAVDAADLTRVLDARVVSKIYPEGMTLQAIVADLVTTYLAAFGITLDPGMAAGPTMTVVTFEAATVTSCLNFLSDRTGFVWRVLPTHVLEMFEVGDKVAPFSLTSTNSKVMGGVEWSKTRGKFVNRQVLKYGPDAMLRVVDVFPAAAGQTVFHLTYPPQAYSGIVWVGATLNDDEQSVTGGVAETATYAGIGDVASWEFDLAAGTMTRVIGALPAGTTVIAFYPVLYPLSVIAEDAASIALAGPWEDVAAAPEVTKILEAIQIAQGLLRRYKVVPRELTIRTREALAFPGDVVTVTIPERLITGDWLITAVAIRTEVDQEFTYTYTCIEGSEAQRPWQDYFRTKFGGQASARATEIISGTGQALNCQDLFAGGGIYEHGRNVAMGDYRPYTPVWTGLTIGDGTVTATEARVGRLTFFTILLVFGSTTSVTGPVLVSLPRACVPYAQSQSLGRLTLFDLSPGYFFPGLTRLVDATTIELRTSDSPSLDLSATSPFTWAAGDQLFITGQFEEP